MINAITDNLISLKQEFAKNYSGSAHIQEVLPSFVSEKFPLNDSHLFMLHEFAKKNPIYFNSYEDTFAGIKCMVYEGDINDYWLNSIKHGTSCQPFYPTWIMSAYIMTMIASNLGYKELVDIGSGDGRIAFCGKLFDLNSFSIEIDEALVELQEKILKSVHKNFNPICADALEFSYSGLFLERPVFFIGGLAQMGGDILATSIIDKLNSQKDLAKNTGLVFAGTHAKRKLSNNLNNGGWNSLIEKHNLFVMKTISLPTVWTFDQKIETPYIYTRFN